MPPPPPDSFRFPSQSEEDLQQSRLTEDVLAAGHAAKKNWHSATSYQQSLDLQAFGERLELIWVLADVYNLGHYLETLEGWGLSRAHWAK